jgi:short-subunit dehydrogenase
MRQVIPGMRRKGAGRIVNISSIGGKIGMPHLIPYDGSKLVGLKAGIIF